MEKNINTQTLDELIARYGDPDDFVLLDATRGNEAVGVLLVYDSDEFFVIDGEKVMKSEVEDVTFYNNAIPYLPNEYDVVIKTKGRQDPFRLHVGNDGNWAMQVVEQIMYHLRKKA
ncbi:MAG: hypothetical protein IKN21_02620 [Prevotella sp.]|nr:hypothetical protein [Prevotella sp.]MBR3726482.1 hypothetical protein [Prevotella sp.]